MGRRFMIISGTGHCGTTWLAKALNDGTEAVVSHEAAHSRDWPEGWKRWLAIDAPIVGAVDGDARCRLSELVPDLPDDTQWLFLLREFGPWVRSLGAHRKGRPLMATAQVIFGCCEVALFELSRLGIKPAPWLMEHVTTPEGFGALCESLRLEIKPGFAFPSPLNATDDAGTVPAVADWPEHIRETVEDLPERGLRLRTAYRKARKRMGG